MGSDKRPFRVLFARRSPEKNEIIHNEPRYGNAPELRSAGEDGLTTASEFQATMYAECVKELRSSAVPSSDVRLHVPSHVVD
jgi:hypothetical protein